MRSNAQTASNQRKTNPLKTRKEKSTSTMPEWLSHHQNNSYKNGNRSKSLSAAVNGLSLVQEVSLFHF